MNNVELVKEFQGIVNQLRQLPLPSSYINQRAQSEVQRLVDSLQELVNLLPQHFQQAQKGGQEHKQAGTAPDSMGTQQRADIDTLRILSESLTSHLPAGPGLPFGTKEWSLRLSLSTGDRIYTAECGTYPLDSVDNSTTVSPDPSSIESVSACCIRAFDTHGNEHDSLCRLFHTAWEAPAE